jgi:hypothetical protein
MMRAAEVHPQVCLGKLFRRAGDAVRAQEHLGAAAAMYREMDMGFWLAQAETELGSLR